VRNLFRRLSRFTGRHARLFSALGIILLWLVYQSNARFIGGSDVYPGRFIPVSLVTEGNYDMDEFLFIRSNNPKNWAPGAKYYMNHPGKPYNNRCLSNSPTLIATLMAPFYIIPFRIYKISPQHYLVFYMDKAFASLFAAFSALFLFYALREKRTPRGAALLITIAYALGTGTWFHSSQAMWQHGPSQCFLALSLWLWVRQGRINRGYFLCGLAVGIAVGARPSNSFWAGLLFMDIFFLREWRRLIRILGVFFQSIIRARAGRIIKGARLFLKHERPIFLYVLGGIPSMLFLAVYNNHHFGSPWTSAYSLFGKGVMDTLQVANLPAGILGILFSPSMGLFPNAPFYLFLPIAIWIALRRPLGAPRKHVIIPVILIIANVLLYTSRRQGWWGGWAYTYRYLTDSLPLFSFLLFPLWRIRFIKIRRAWFKLRNFKYRMALRLNRFGRWAVWGLFFVFTLWGMAIQAYGVYAWSGNFYSQWANINQKLTINLKNHAPHSIFDKPSVFWTLDKDKHLIRCELKWFHWKPGKWFTTPGKVYHDLFVRKLVKYGQYPPIVLDIGMH